MMNLCDAGCLTRERVRKRQQDALARLAELIQQE
jgi:hypothetical protein